VLEGDAHDRGDVILGWLTRIVASIAIVAVLGFDALSIAVTHVSTKDDANTAAVAASAAWRSDHGDLTATLQAAQASVAGHNETVVATSLYVDPDGTVHLKVQHVASTLLAKHVDAAWANVVVEGSGRSTS
jgi:hypothetical protein